MSRVLRLLASKPDSQAQLPLRVCEMEACMHACMHACFSSSAHAANEACGTGKMQWIASARSRTFVGASKDNCAAAPAPLVHDSTSRHLICCCLVLALLLLIAGTVACTRKQRKTSSRGNLCLKVKAAVVGPAIQESPKVPLSAVNAQRYCSVGYSCNRPWEREKASSEVQTGKPKGTLESESRIAW